MDKGRDPLDPPAAPDEDGEASDGALEDGRRVLVLLAEDVREGEEDVVGQLAVQTGGLGAQDCEELVEEVREPPKVRGAGWGLQGEPADGDAAWFQLVSLVSPRLDELLETQVGGNACGGQTFWNSSDLAAFGSLVAMVGGGAWALSWDLANVHHGDPL